MSELIKVLKLILNDDWHDLLMLLTMDEIKANHIATSSDDYIDRAFLEEINA